MNLSITDDLKSPGDADDEISDTDTTDEDLGQDFWLRHKKVSTLAYSILLATKYSFRKKLPLNIHIIYISETSSKI